MYIVLGSREIIAMHASIYTQLQVVACQVTSNCNGIVSVQDSIFRFETCESPHRNEN